MEGAGRQHPDYWKSRVTRRRGVDSAGDGDDTADMTEHAPEQVSGCDQSQSGIC